MSTLRSKQQKAVILFAAGEPKEAVAEKVGVELKTISKWLENSEFQYKIDKEKQAAHERFLSGFRRLEPKATHILEDIMENSDNPADRLKAAEIVLKYAKDIEPPGPSLFGSNTPYT